MNDLRGEQETEIARLTARYASDKENSPGQLKDLAKKLEYEKQRFEISEEHYELLRRNMRKLADANSKHFHNSVDLHKESDRANAAIRALKTELGKAEEDRNTADALARQAQLELAGVQKDYESKKNLADDLLSKFQASSARNLGLEEKYEGLRNEYE